MSGVLKEQNRAHLKVDVLNLHNKPQSREKNFKNRPIFVIFGMIRHLALIGHFPCARHFVAKKIGNFGVFLATFWRIFDFLSKNGENWPFGDKFKIKIFKILILNFPLFSPFTFQF